MRCCLVVLSLVIGSDCFKPEVYPARITDQCGQQAAILNDQLMETLRNIHHELQGVACSNVIPVLYGTTIYVTIVHAS